MEEQVDPRHLLANIARILERLGIPYMITGGMAVLIWGRVRFTADIDIVIELRAKNIQRLAQELLSVSHASYVDRDTMERALETNGEFNFIDGETGVKVDFWVLGKDAFDKLRLKRRVSKNILGQTVYFISPEDLILSKLRWHQENGSSRHIEDVESILKISGEMLDVKYLKAEAAKQNTIDTLNKILNSQ